jgi:outer membrane protein
VKYWLVGLLLALTASVAAAQDRVKIGYVDIQRVIGESKAGKIAKERFQAQVKKAEGDVQRERQELERMRADLDKKGPLLKDEERRNMEAEFQKRSVQLQRALGDYQQDLRNKENEMMADILKDLEGVVTEFGKAEKYTVIVERSQVLYSDSGTDITTRVIVAFNNRAPAKPAPAAPKGK